MKKTKLYNNLSPELIKSTILKPGETVTYKLIGLQKDPFNKDRWIVPASVNIRPVDRIYDEVLGDYVDIACIQSVLANGDVVFQDIFFEGSNAGVLILHGGRAIDQIIHSYLLLSNYNGSNPKRDTSVAAVYELVNENAKAEETRKTRNLRREALNTAADMKPQEARDFAAAMGWDDKRELTVIRNLIEEYADLEPKNFLTKYNNKQLVMKATIKRALDAGVILFNPQEAKFVWPNSEVITTVPRTAGTDHIEGLLAYCLSNTRGEKVYQEILKSVRKEA